jgi:hypothetical protein
MAYTSSRRLAAPDTLSLPVLQSGARQADPERWVGPVGKIALAVFVAVPIFALLVPSLAGRVVWTVLIAGLPLFIVLVGYHRWRRICPLAFFAQIPARFNRSGKRRAPPWLEENYYYVAFGVFFVSLWLRLNATNGNGYAIAIFFVILAVAAIAAGFLYTGKTWCNFLCPVSFVEKIYTEPHGLRETANSQCAKCTACKHGCPDINEENGYWSEITSQPKKSVFFAFWGVVFAFYFYYYLQAGTWNYYFGGAWTNEPGVLGTAFLPGHDAKTAGFFFLPLIPRALASLLTLAFFGFFTYQGLSRLEAPLGRWLQRRNKQSDAARVRHVMLSLSGFAAFVTFYTFAGAPTLRKVSWAPHFFGILVVVVATLSLVRRLPRTRKSFAEESMARNLIKRWAWADQQPPGDLREAFWVHTTRLRDSEKGYEQLLRTYREAVRETAADGLVSLEDLQMMESLRDRLSIKPADYEAIISELAEEERKRVNQSAQELSPEKRLQLDSYAEVLKGYLERVLGVGGVPKDSSMTQLRSEYRITKEEHLAVLDQIFQAHGKGGLGLAYLKQWAKPEESAAEPF